MKNYKLYSDLWKSSRKRNYFRSMNIAKFARSCCQLVWNVRWIIWPHMLLFGERLTRIRCKRWNASDTNDVQFLRIISVCASTKLLLRETVSERFGPASFAAVPQRYALSPHQINVLVFGADGGKKVSQNVTLNYCYAGLGINSLWLGGILYRARDGILSINESLDKTTLQKFLNNNLLRSDM